MPQPNELRDAFCRWNGGAMASAPRSMIEAVLEAKLSDDAVQDLGWTFRELLGGVALQLGHTARWAALVS